jgi:hypothetical protein
MTETALELTGEGVIRQMFRLTGRGWVVVLEDGFSGKVAVGSLLESPSGRTPIKAVEFVDGLEGNSWVGLMIAESEKHLFEPGHPVKFYKQL